MSWTVLVHPEAATELSKLPAREMVAVHTALDKLRAIGPTLGYPHSSAVRGSDRGLRELRPRQGRSPWRGFYGQVGSALVVLGIGPEANVDPKGFDRAVSTAERRLSDIEEDW